MLRKKFWWENVWKKVFLHMCVFVCVVKVWMKKEEK
jgi:hypothetical protein